MKTKIFIVQILLLTSMTSCYVQKRKNMRWIIEPYEFGIPEKYDPLNKTEGGTKWVMYKHNDWLTEIWEKNARGEGYSIEYAPASDFYEILKYYHPNDMLKSRVKYTLGVTFGKKEFFDEQGILINVEDRDAQFEGVRIKREDVLEILQKAEVFNLKTGKHSIIDNHTIRGERLTNPLKTDGTFYRLLEDYITFSFAPAVIEDGKEITPPMWYVRVKSFDQRINYLSVFNINAHTGHFTVDKSEIIMIPPLHLPPDD